MAGERLEGPDQWAAEARVRSRFSEPLGQPEFTPPHRTQQLCFVDCGKAAPECKCRMDAMPFHQPQKCPDNGTCHHGCGDVCSRVNSCGPLSGVFPDDTWPAYVLETHRED